MDSTYSPLASCFWPCGKAGFHGELQLVQGAADIVDRKRGRDRKWRQGPNIPLKGMSWMTYLSSTSSYLSEVPFSSDSALGWDQDADMQNLGTVPGPNHSPAVRLQMAVSVTLLWMLPAYFSYREHSDHESLLTGVQVTSTFGNSELRCLSLVFASGARE